jgi:hypothetical protein
VTPGTTLARAIDTALSPEEISPQFSKTKQRSGVKNSFDEVAFTIFGFLSLNRLLDAYAFLNYLSFLQEKGDCGNAQNISIFCLNAQIVKL